MQPDEGQMTRAILWDMDGTLIDSEPVHGKAFDAAVAELGLSFPPHFHDQLLGRSSAEVHAAVAAKMNRPFSYQDWMALKWGHFLRHADDMHRRDSLADIAVQKAAEGLPMALVSNSTADGVVSQRISSGHFSSI